MPAARAAFAFCTLHALLAAPPAAAHFPWLATDQEGRAVMWFGESLSERDYHLPEALRSAEVMATDAKGVALPLSLPEVDEAGFIGRRSAGKAPKGAGLHATVTYGVYHGTKLVYYAQHDPAVGKTPLSRPAEAQQLRAELSRSESGELRIRVFWKAGSLPGATIELLRGDGETVATAEAGDDGAASFDADALPSGLAAVRVGHTIEGDSGEIAGKQHATSTHYLTATFRVAAQQGADANAPPEGDLPALPQPIASFGAAVSDGWLYVYSGHTDTAHVHSRANLSRHFVRIRLAGEGDAAASDWQPLPMAQPLQGLPLVAHGGKVYRVGGLEARNKRGEDEQLHSQAAFARFDPTLGEWRELAPLPEPRSSHDAVVIRDKLYVIGGWTLAGSSDGTWLDTAWSCDLSADNPTWEKLPSPNVRRRALAAAHLAGNPVVLGGMNEDGDVLSAVSMLDVATGKWVDLPDLPGDGMCGFGASAWNHGGVMYASGMEGLVYALENPRGEWRRVAQLRTARFFHRLLPAGDKLLAVGGASPEFGHLATTELIELRR